MIQISDIRASALARIETRAVARVIGMSIAVAGLVMSPGPAAAARVEGLYGASVPVSDSSPAGLKAAYAEALRRILVKVTGRDAAGRDNALLARLGDPASLVQQYRRDETGALAVQVDPAAVRAGLEAAGYAVWGDDRPMTLVWLAFESSKGERDIVSGSDAGAPGAAPGTSGPEPVAAGLRRELLAAADNHGVPVRLPLRDAQDAAAAGDVFGDAVERISGASLRYRPDAVLIGKIRPPSEDVAWLLLVGNERLEWRGAVADGPAGLAERLVARLAAATPSEQSLQLLVTGLRSFDDYGMVLAYLQGLDIITDCGVVRVKDDNATFVLRVRGDRSRLERVLSVRRVLEPEAAEGSTAAGRGADLVYRFAAGS